ncbi:MAG TPA: hypothetical protein ENN13_01795 [Candidatus Altiarchaeales archaeon]|nr:hypothetical protein [Candidatus Altiarchaeales archaeon]
MKFLPPVFAGIFFVLGCCCMPPAPDSGATTTSTISASAADEFTLEEIKTGRALECSFTNAIDNWDWTYKTVYPKVRVEHKRNEDNTQIYTVLGDVEAIDWKGCRPESEECFDVEFTEMYLMMEEVPRYMQGQVQSNIWYKTPLFHDFGDFDIVMPEALVYYIHFFEKASAQSDEVSVTCRWLSSISESEFTLPFGVTPLEVPEP